MTTDDVTGLDRLLERLPLADSDVRRAATVRSRCHRVLARRRATFARARRAPRLGRRPLETMVVGAFSVIYLSVVILIALGTHGAR